MSLFRRLKRCRKIKRASINPLFLTKTIDRSKGFEHKSKQRYHSGILGGVKKSDCGFKLNVNLSDIETPTHFLPETLRLLLKRMPCSRGPGTPGKSEGDQGIEDRGLRNTHQVFTLCSWPVTHCQSDSLALCHAISRLLSHNAMRDCLAFFVFHFKMVRKNRIMEPYLGLKWGNHCYHEWRTLFLKHNHEW